MSNVVNYETLMLASTEITNDELVMLERYFDKLLADYKGKLVVFDRWGKYRLAYPVNKNSYGVYILSRYTIPSEQIDKIFKELNSFFKIKCNEIISRHLTVKLGSEISLTYQKPDSIDGGREPGNLDSFLKENKMEGLLDSVKPSSKNKIDDINNNATKEVKVSKFDNNNNDNVVEKK